MDLHNPYQAPGASLDMPSASVDKVELAPRSTRLYAALMDRLLTIAGAVLGLLTGTSVALAEKQFNIPNVLPLLLPLGVGLINLALFVKSGQTIGKWLFRIKIVRDSGERCGLRRFLFLRALPLGVVAGVLNYTLTAHFGYSPSSSMALFFIPQIGKYTADALDAVFIFRASRKCLHDNIADTKVVLA